jgi:multidrug resistance efflux pump
MSEMYEPDNQFLERLEWQLSSEYRRANRLKTSSGKVAVPRMAVALSLVLGILVTSVAVTKAADYIRDSWRKKIEIARAETDVTLKKAHLESITVMESQAESRASSGLIREDEHLMIKIAAEGAELDLERSQLNLEEVKATGVAPRDELYAPKVRGRDFVSERLTIEKKKLELDLKRLRNHRERIQQLVKENLTSMHEFNLIQADIASRDVMIKKIQERLDLRKSFLSGKATVREIEIKGRLVAAERTLYLAQTKVDSLEKQLKRLKDLEIQGKISSLEVKRLQYDLDAAQAELKLAALEKDVLEAIK